MKYNIYCKDKYNEHVCAYIKINDWYNWIDIKGLNGDYYAKYCTKVSLNIFEAKQLINGEKIRNKHRYVTGSREYWVEQVKD